MLVPGAWIPRHPPVAQACPLGGRWDQAGTLAGSEPQTARADEEISPFPSSLISLSLCCQCLRASSPPPTTMQVCGFIIWGLREGGTVTWKHLVLLSGLVPQPFPVEVEVGQAGPFESGL